MPNPFDILPPHLFNLFTTVGFASLQRHYMAILIRIYNLAEFNRFGLARETVIAEIVDYIRESDAERDVEADMALQSDPEADSVSLAGSKPEHVYAAYLLRRLADSGWIEREQHADYSETIILPDYSFTLLEAFRSIQEQKPREFKGQLYAAYQLITSSQTHKDFSATLAVSQTYENIRQVVRGLNELHQNIRRYVERATKQMPVADLLRLQFDDYTQTLGPSYHALKTSDHVSRYRRDIVNQIQEWLINDEWLSRTAEELAAQSRLSPAQAEHEITQSLLFIVHQLEGLDPLLNDIDARHAQYLRTSLRQVRYQLNGADGNFKDRLVSLARHLSALRLEGMTELPEDSPQLRQFPVKIPDAHSFFTPPQKRAPFVPNSILSPVLAPADLVTLRADTMRDVTQAFSPDKVNRKVLGFFNGHKRLSVNEIPVSDDLHWLTTIIAYAHHPEVSYGLEVVEGEAVQVGQYKVMPFELVKL
ncbi:MAG: Wadjet anti-phage system protein JetA family protein [Chloroflexota bacterium]